MFREWFNDFLKILIMRRGSSSNPSTWEKLKNLKPAASSSIRYQNIDQNINNENDI